MRAQLRQLNEQASSPAGQARASRQALRLSVREHHAAVATLEKIHTAKADAEQALTYARTQLTAAEAALEGARSNENEVLAAMALGENIDGVVPIEAAEAELKQKQVDLAVVKRTIVALDERAEHQAAEVERRRRDVADAIRFVLQNEVNAAELLSRGRQLQDELIAVRLWLRHLQRFDALANADTEPVRRFLWDRELPCGLGNLELPSWDRHQVTLDLAAAADRLREDADAQLPRLDAQIFS